MRLGRGSFSQNIDYLSVTKNLACQLVQKTHAWHPIVQKPHTCYPLVHKPHSFHCLRNSCKNILQIWRNIVPLQDRCGEICLLATTLKNAKMLTNGDRMARKPLFISMFCVFVTSPHPSVGRFFVSCCETLQLEPVRVKASPFPETQDSGVGVMC